MQFVPFTFGIPRSPLLHPISKSTFGLTKFPPWTRFWESRWMPNIILTEICMNFLTVTTLLLHLKELPISLSNLRKKGCTSFWGHSLFKKIDKEKPFHFSIFIQKCFLPEWYCPLKSQLLPFSLHFLLVTTSICSLPLLVPLAWYSPLFASILIYIFVCASLLF